MSDLASVLNAGRPKTRRIQPPRALPFLGLATVTIALAVAGIGLTRLVHIVSGKLHGPRTSTSTPRGATPARYTKLVWSDDFNGPAGAPPATSRWIHDNGAWGYSDNEVQTYTDSAANASLDGQGHLAIVARRETYTGPDHRTRNYTSARLETQGLFSARYGLVEVRMKIPSGAGLWPAFWLLGDNVSTAGWPASGEIDVLEALGQHPSTAHGYLNGPSVRAPHYTVSHATSSRTSLASGFHTYAVSWSRNSITWLLDGVPYGTTTPKDLPAGARWVFNRPFHLVLNLAVGGDYGGPPTSSTRFPATLLVDWVRVYQ